MIPRQQPLEPTAILFAAGGASGHTDPDTLDAYRLAVRLGATGIETALHATADGDPVLRLDPRLGGLRRRRIGDAARADLGGNVVTVDAFYDGIGTETDLLVHVADPAAVDATLAIAEAHDATARLWLASSDAAALRTWRERSARVRLADTTALSAVTAGLERHAATLRERSVDAALAPHSEWSGGRTALFHRFGRRCIATNAPHVRMIRTALHIGIDGVSSAFPDRLVDAAVAAAAPDAPVLLDP